MGDFHTRKRQPSPYLPQPLSFGDDLGDSLPPDLSHNLWVKHLFDTDQGRATRPTVASFLSRPCKSKVTPICFDPARPLRLLSSDSLLVEF